MNIIDWSVRQFIYEHLQSTGLCSDLRIGSDYVDCSYFDYSNAITFTYRECLFHIRIDNLNLLVVMNNGPMSIHILFDDDVEIAEPDFQNIVEILCWCKKCADYLLSTENCMSDT